MAYEEFYELRDNALAPDASVGDFNELGYYLEVCGFSMWNGEGWLIDDDHMLTRDGENYILHTVE